MLVILFLYKSVICVFYQSAEASCLKQRDRLSEGLAKGLRSSLTCLQSAFGGRRFITRLGPLALLGAATDGGVGAKVVFLGGAAG